MKADINGCSTCPKGKERHERFQTPSRGRRGTLRSYIQYEYRHTNGGLFTCIKPTLAECREARDRALANGTIY